MKFEDLILSKADEVCEDLKRIEDNIDECDLLEEAFDISKNVSKKIYVLFEMFKLTSVKFLGNDFLQDFNTHANVSRILLELELLKNLQGFSDIERKNDFTEISLNLRNSIKDFLDSMKKATIVNPDIFLLKSSVGKTPRLAA